MYSIDTILDALAPGALLLASPVFLYTAFKDWRRKVYFRRYGIEAEGIVVRVEERKEEEHILRIPIVSFSTQDMHWITLPYEGGNLANKLQTGQTILLRYDPTNYKDFIIPVDESSTTIWLCLLAGASLFTAGVVSLAKAQ
ncbi:DUF3592 domain-containing protein [Hymenobacter metallicola]|uniref:DUF3592 domain-containing protein n=1 Tax=Hymenobacter metallicola TaxID=2563114 RepID=A0A4Z0QFP3_9BACT|nr:DUF3592 domain-containing protein [Hymenobacter metallicola]TGE28149.1 hypothetical protein E5K02_01410 [Hymenobacter metallicola]